jgi:tetratricopeptide (TPR) repeat protein
LSVGNLEDPGITHSEIEISPVKLYSNAGKEGASQSVTMPAPTQPAYILCVLKTVEPKVDAKVEAKDNQPQYDQQWEGSLDVQFEGYRWMEGDRVTVHFFQQSIVEAVPAVTDIQVTDETEAAQDKREMQSALLRGGQSGILSGREDAPSGIGGGGFANEGNYATTARLWVNKDGRVKAKIQLARKKEKHVESARSPQLRVVVRAILLRKGASDFADAGRNELELSSIAMGEKAKTHLQSAIASLSRAATLDSKNPRYPALLADAYLRNDQFQEAVQFYKAAVELEPENARTQNGLAWALFRAGRSEEGWQYAQKAVRLKGNDSASWDTYAHIAFESQKWSEAADGWDNVMKFRGHLSSDDHVCEHDHEKWKEAHQKAGTPLPELKPKK